MDRSSPVVPLTWHRVERAAFYNAGQLVLAEGSQEIPLMQAADIPATHRGPIPFQVQNALAAAAACWGAGVPLDFDQLGLRTFQTDDKAPGRFNVFQVGRPALSSTTAITPMRSSRAGGHRDDEAQADDRRDSRPRRPARR